MRGRKPIPKAVKELQSTRKGATDLREVNAKRAQSRARAARTVNKEPRPAAVLASPPAGATFTNAVDAKTSIRRAYKRTAKSLLKVGLLDEQDKQALMLMSMHYVIALRAFGEMEALTRDDENGVTRKHPLLQVIRDASEMFKGYAAEFGMTPSSRERLALNPEDEGDPFERFLEGVDL